MYGHLVLNGCTNKDDPLRKCMMSPPVVDPHLLLLWHWVLQNEEWQLPSVVGYAPYEAAADELQMRHRWADDCVTCEGLTTRYYLLTGPWTYEDSSLNQVSSQKGGNHQWRIQEGALTTRTSQSKFFHFHAVFCKNFAKQWIGWRITLGNCPLGKFWIHYWLQPYSNFLTSFIDS